MWNNNSTLNKTKLQHFYAKKKKQENSDKSNLIYEIKLCIYLSIVSSFDKQHYALFQNHSIFAKMQGNACAIPQNFVFPTIIIAGLFLHDGE